MFVDFWRFYLWAHSYEGKHPKGKKRQKNASLYSNLFWCTWFRGGGFGIIETLLGSITNLLQLVDVLPLHSWGWVLFAFYLWLDVMFIWCFTWFYLKVAGYSIVGLGFIWFFFVCIGAIPALFKGYSYFINADFGIQGEGWCLFNVWLLIFVILDFYFFVSFVLPEYNPQPAPKGGVTLCFCWLESVLFVDLCNFFTTLRSQLQTQGPKDKRGDKTIFQFILFFGVLRSKEGIWVCWKF